MSKIRKLEKQKKQIEDSYEPDLSKAYKEKDDEKLHSLLQERDWELRPIECKIFVEMTRRIRQQAEKLDIEIPSYADKESWETDRQTELTYMTPKGRSNMRKLIDQEEGRRFEKKIRWVKLLVPLVTALAALAGAITGIVLALKK